MGAATEMIAANWTEWVSSQEWRTEDASLIPAAPRALGDAFRLANEPAIDVRRLVTIVSQDPVFTIRVLRLANVAAFAAAGDVKSIELAIVRLGTHAVRHAVLAACFSSWAQTVHSYGPGGAGEIQHAVGTACLARHVATRLDLGSDDAFVHGLLHDVGKLVLLKLRGQYLRLGGRAPSAAEFDGVLARHHGEVGAVALQTWGIPQSICEPVRWHHAPLDAGEHIQAASLVYLSDRLSHRYGFGRSPADGDTSLETDPAGATLGLGEGWVAEMDQQAASIGIAARHLVS